MRSITRTLTLTLAILVVSSSSATFAADRSTREPRLRDSDPGIVRVVKRIVKRVFGVTTTEDIVGPKP